MEQNLEEEIREWEEKRQELEERLLQVCVCALVRLRAFVRVSALFCVRARRVCVCVKGVCVCEGCVCVCEGCVCVCVCVCVKGATLSLCFRK